MPYTKKLDQFLDILDSLTESEKVWSSLTDYAYNFTINALTYYHKPPPGALDINNNYFYAHGFNSDAIIEHERLIPTFDNPLTDRSCHISTPFLWSEITKKVSFTPTQRDILLRLYPYETEEGLLIPVHGAQNRNGCIVLRFKDADVVLTKREIRNLEWACNKSHCTYSKLRRRETRQTIALTSREKEVLTWVARGKSNSVIADIIGISQHTVNGYLRRVYLKTGTSDRTTATLTALGESLINV